MAEVVVATIVRNEAHRYLRSALDQWSMFADKIVLFDNGSEDNTREIIKEFPAVIEVTPPSGGKTPMWGREAKFRQYLARAAMEEAGEGNIVFWLDADMIPRSDPSHIFSIETITRWNFILYDLWETKGELKFRTDSYWKGHTNFRCWAIRVTEEAFEAASDWNERGIHCGHAPAVAAEHHQNLYCPPNVGLLHYGYATKADRAERIERYRGVGYQLSEFERNHAASIADAEPKLESLMKLDYELIRATDKVIV